MERVQTKLREGDSRGRKSHIQSNGGVSQASCQIDELNGIIPEIADSCSGVASWLAVYETEDRQSWQTALLCHTCKKQVQHRLRVGPNEACESIITLKNRKCSTTGSEPK